MVKVEELRPREIPGNSISWHQRLYTEQVQLCFQVGTTHLASFRMIARASSILSGDRVEVFPCIVPVDKHLVRFIGSTAACRQNGITADSEACQEMAFEVRCVPPLPPPRPPRAAATSLLIGSVLPPETSKNLASPPFFVELPAVSNIACDNHTRGSAVSFTPAIS